MEAILVNPYRIKEGVVGNRARQPLDLAYIASLLREANHEVEILDANVLKIPTAETINYVNKNSPDIVFLSSSPLDRWECPFLDYQEIREICEKIKVAKVIIGPHGTLAPDEIFENCNVDFVIRGEPEYTAQELVNSLENGTSLTRIRGLSYCENGHISHNLEREFIQDLDSLPFPAYDLLPMDKYEYNDSSILPKPFSIVLSSRGCPFKCIFCLKVMYGDKHRIRSPKNVIEELELLANHHNISSVYFQDLEFTLNKDRVFKICDEIITRGLKLNWACASRVTDANKELFQKMKEAGCKRISFGVESFNDEILKNVKKGITTQAIENAMKIAKEVGIDFNPFWQTCLPGESYEALKETIRFAAKNKIPYPLIPNIPIPYLGTELYDMARKEGIINADGWESCKRGIGKVGSNVKYNVLLLFKIQNMYFKEKYGKFYFLKPSFYATEKSKLVSILKEDMKYLIKSLRD